MSDEVSSTIGDDADTVAAGKNIRQTRNQGGSAHSDPSQNLYFSNPDNLQLWLKIVELGSQIRDITTQLDNLPERVRRLEGLEVVVRPAEVVIRPSTDSVSLSVRTIFTTLITVLLVVVALIIFLIYLQAVRP